MVSISNSIPERHLIPRLLERAEAKGFLTPDDLLEIAPELASDLDQLENLIELIDLSDIPIEISENFLPTLSLYNERPEDEMANLEHIASDDTISLYLKEMSITPLLTLEEEIELAKRIENAQQARTEIMQKHTHLDLDHRRELEARIQDGMLAREALIKANTRLVVSIARRYSGSEVPFLDLVQEGNLGLMKAVEKFEHQRGFRFSTYATWWIRQSIIRAAANQGRTIRVPLHMSDRIRMLYKVGHQMEQQLGRKPTIDELAERLEVESSKVRWMLQVSQPPISLETPVGDEDETELGMYVEDYSTPSPAQVAYENMLREKVDEVLATLSPREARVLRLRFGLGQERQYTLEEVGQKFGLTRERIRQIEGKALRQLRQPNRASMLREYRS